MTDFFAKVTYVQHNGYVTKAYLVNPPLSDGSYTGTNKHTDEPVHVLWHEGNENWFQVCERTFEMVPPLYETFRETGERPDCICKTEGRP